MGGGKFYREPGVRPTSPAHYWRCWVQGTQTGHPAWGCRIVPRAPGTAPHPPDPGSHGLCLPSEGTVSPKLCPAMPWTAGHLGDQALKAPMCGSSVSEEDAGRLGSRAS